MNSTETAQHIATLSRSYDAARAEIDSLRAQLDAANARNAELEAKVYCPGLWRCVKCEFTLIQSNLNVLDGSVTARDDPGDKCPNCGSPLWRVSEREERMGAS